MGCTQYDAWKTTPPEPKPDADDPTGLQDPRQCDWCEHHGPDVRRVETATGWRDDCCPACLLKHHSMLICTGCDGLVDTLDAKRDGPEIHCQACHRIDTESP